MSQNRLLESAKDGLIDTIRELVKEAENLDRIASRASVVTDETLRVQFKGVASGLRLAAQMLQKDLDAIRFNLGEGL